MSEAVTRGVRVKVKSRYMPERSNLIEPTHFFVYFITITDEGKKPVTLKNRYWHITDATGHVEEVRGEGVVGYQPRLDPGQSFKYSSFCPLRTEFGVMKGTYEMFYDNGESFEAEIAPFQLFTPQSVN